MRHNIGHSILRIEQFRINALKDFGLGLRTRIEICIFNSNYPLRNLYNERFIWCKIPLEYRKIIGSHEWKKEVLNARSLLMYFKITWVVRFL